MTSRSVLQILFAFVASVTSAAGQKPVISPGGLVNAASYYSGVNGLAPGSIASIFGSNLASAPMSAEAATLPLTLEGTTVTYYGIPVPIFYVSPTQINIQVPSSLHAIGADPQLVVTTPAGSSDPLPLDTAPLGAVPFGIFSLDASDCGPGAIFNVATDGSVSLNSPTNSVSPGQFITIWGTGLAYDFGGGIPDGSPTPFNPLVHAAENANVYFDQAGPAVKSGTLPWAQPSFAGRAPGFIGLDQINVQVPMGVREGCAVPLVVFGNTGNSQDIPISIRTGGGPCVDPPAAGLGQIVWERNVQMATGAETDTLTASFQSSPGMQPPAPLAPQYQEGEYSVSETQYGKHCAVPGYQSLDGGTITAAPPGGPPVQAAPVWVNGQTVYQAALPPGAILPGSFSFSAGGGDVGAFQASTQVGSGIQITSSFPPGTTIPTIPLYTPFSVKWTGGDPNEWVTVTVVGHDYGLVDQYRWVRVHASDGVAYMPGFLPDYTLGIGGTQPGQAEIIVEVDPDPSQIQTISVPGLSLGAQATWKYTYHFTGLTLQ